MFLSLSSQFFFISEPLISRSPPITYRESTKTNPLFLQTLRLTLLSSALVLPHFIFLISSSYFFLSLGFPLFSCILSFSAHFPVQPCENPWTSSLETHLRRLGRERRGGERLSLFTGWGAGALTDCKSCSPHSFSSFNLCRLLQEDIQYSIFKCFLNFLEFTT